LERKNKIHLKNLLPVGEYQNRKKNYPETIYGLTKKYFFGLLSDWYLPPEQLT
jgi:hypothetical protein